MLASIIVEILSQKNHRKRICSCIEGFNKKRRNFNPNFRENVEKARERAVTTTAIVEVRRTFRDVLLGLLLNFQMWHKGDE